MDISWIRQICHKGVSTEPAPQEVSFAAVVSFTAGEIKHWSLPSGGQGTHALSLWYQLGGQGTQTLLSVDETYPGIHSSTRH
jgi:hypothetical protein